MVICSILRVFPQHAGSCWNRCSSTSLIIGLVVGIYLSQMHILSTPSQHEYLRYAGELVGQEGPEVNVRAHQHAYESSSISTKLSNEVRVLCWIMTSPKNHKSKARHVKRTWGQRCNKLVFMSSKLDKELGTVSLPVKDSNLWGKTKEALKYIYAHHLDDADWFYKANDDTYSVMENMRYFLYPYSPETPIFFGCKFKPYVNQGKLSGGAGYILSKEALRLFVEKAIPNKDFCKQDNNKSFEDVKIGKCLEKLNVIADDSRDQHARGRFIPFVKETHETLSNKSNKHSWYCEYPYYKTNKNSDCCSDKAISFHSISPSKMYAFEYLIYHLWPYGIINTPEVLPERLKADKTIPPPSE